jgi:hypothetical protein
MALELILSLLQTIDTMKKLFNGFYAFTDLAKEQPVQGFDYKAIDIISEIDKLSQKSYANDFEFSVRMICKIIKIIFSNFV